MMKKIKWLLWQFVMMLGGMACCLLMFAGAVGLAAFLGGPQGTAVAVALVVLAVLYVDARERGRDGRRKDLSEV